MTAQDRIAAPGTDEAVWGAWLPGVDWPWWTPDLAWSRVAVCAAHPDDEVLGAGGALALLAAAGVALDLIAVTDGEASHPGSTAHPPGGLRRARAAESEAALAELGVVARVTRLGMPDSGLAARQEELDDRLAAAVAGCDAVLAPWTGDAHPDHEAVGRAAVAAGVVPVWQYPVWTWHWARPGDPRVPWDAAHRVGLPPALRAAKRAAVGRFRTQVQPLGPAPADRAVLPPEELAHFDRDLEVLFR